MRTTLAALALAYGLTAVPSPPPSPSPAPSRHLHKDPAALEQGLVDTLRAYARQDPDGIAAGLGKMEGACRAIADDPDAGFPKEVVTHDRAYHKVVATCGEWAKKGDLDQFLEAYLWLARSCGRCHAAAESAGVKPARPVSSSSPAGSGSPTPPSGSRPSR